jgi:hypothetical protein
MDFDIALIKLKTKALLTDRVQLICLPERYAQSMINREAGNVGFVSCYLINVIWLISAEF